MGPTQWNHILTLLAITVVVDGRVYKEEVDTFVARTLSLKEETCLLYTSPSPRDATLSRMPSSA